MFLDLFLINLSWIVDRVTSKLPIRQIILFRRNHSCARNQNGKEVSDSSSSQGNIYSVLAWKSSTTYHYFGNFAVHKVCFDWQQYHSRLNISRWDWGELIRLHENCLIRNRVRILNFRAVTDTIPTMDCFEQSRLISPDLICLLKGFLGASLVTNSMSERLPTGMSEGLKILGRVLMGWG